MAKKEILGIIPARGGSKGIPRKNIRLLGGKPLIAYSIEEAKKSKLLTRVLVSTEDNEITENAKKFGCEVMPRPREFATDSTTMDMVISDVLRQLKEKEGYVPDIIVLLHPTSPLRIAEDIDGTISTYLDNECGSVIAVSEQLPPPAWAWKIEKGYLKPMMDKKYFSMNRQQLPKGYFDAPVYVEKPEIYLKNKSWITRKTLPYFMPAERAVDIDTELEFQFAEFLLEKRKANEK